MKTISTVLAAMLMLVATGLVQASSHSSAESRMADAEKADQSKK